MPADNDLIAIQGARHGEIWNEGEEQGQEGDARAQARRTEERSLGQESEESQASDCDRSLASATRRCEGAEEESFKPEITGEEILSEKIVEPQRIEEKVA